MNTLMPMTRLIDAALNGTTATCNPHAACAATPRADVIEGEQEYRILMDMPGVKADALEVNVEHQTLTVKAERQVELPEGFEARRRERAECVGFNRTFRLGNAVEAEGIKANLEDGVLEITLPKSEQSVARRIQVN
ncbi:MAG: Hsp20/alpha crystallin family protein [bacterium]|nr:Hsp20/alpha crystallin family protein [bacterium]